ncbi:MAG: GNAT family N-acetyltransferase [bacterium]
MMSRSGGFIRHQSERWHRFRANCGREGGAGRWRALWGFLKGSVYERFEGYVYTLEPLRTESEPPRKIPYEVEELREPMDLSFLHRELTLENVRARLENGEHGFVAMYDNTAIGTAWLTTVRTYFPGLEYRVIARSPWLNFSRTEGYTYRVVVDPKYRGSNIHLALYNARISRAMSLGVKRLVASTGAGNATVHKIVHDLGWVRQRRVVCWRICGILIRRTLPA